MADMTEVQKIKRSMRLHDNLAVGPELPGYLSNFVQRPHRGLAVTLHRLRARQAEAG